MGTYVGTGGNDTIVPGSVSGGVSRSPAGSTPSGAADTINGLGGADLLDGGGGVDLIFGGTGSDRIYGRDGNDRIFGKTAGIADASDGDTIYGGTGNDIIYGNGGEEDTGSPDGNDTIYGEDGNDQLFGKLGSDTLYGGDGDDRVAGYVGNDIHYGGAGDDFLRGGDGRDLLSGDSGNDTYNYQKVSHSPAGSGRDTILNYNGVGAAAGDRIGLAEVDANTGAGGNQTFVFRGTGGFTGAGQVRVVNQGGDTLVQINTSGSGGAEMEILVRDGGADAGSWVAGDFIL